MDLEQIKEKTKQGFNFVVDRTQNLIGKYITKYEFKFKKENPAFQSRRKQSEELLKKYPQKIPIILEKDPKCNITEIKKKNFFVLIDKLFLISMQ
jgi:hypothetical protein